MITGASAGIGEAAARYFAKEGASLILAARRYDKLLQLASSLEDEYSVKVLPILLDVSDKQKVSEAISALDEYWQKVDILVNNAGMGVTSDLMQNASIDDWDKIIDINVKGLLYVTKAVLNSMIKRNSGHIINIGSVAAHDYYMGGNVYSASKHAVKAISRSLRIDVKGYDIRVSQIDPGMVKTEFSERRWDKQKAEKFYEGVVALQAEDIADAILYCATRPKHVTISDMKVYPSAQVAPTIVHREGDKQVSLFD